MPPTAPASLQGTIDNGQLVLRWGPATDNSGVIQYYTVWIDGQQSKTLGGSTYEYYAGPAATADSHIYRVQATDGSGNTSPLSEGVTGIPSLVGKTQAQASAALQAAGFTDGVVTGSSYLNVNDSPSLATGQWAGGNSWADAVTGNNALAALSLQRSEGSAALRGQQQLLAIVSTAEITLPDPVAYRRDWQHYRVRLAFGTPPGEAETREIPAPAPLPQ